MTLLQERERQLNEKLQLTNEALRKSQEGLSREYQRAEALLLNILPASIAERLKAHEQIADNHAEVSVLFADIVGFTEKARSVGAETNARYVKPLLQGGGSALGTNMAAKRSRQSAIV